METVFKYWQHLFTLSANSNGFYLQFVKIANMWKAFPSPLMVNEYHDKYQYCMIWKKVLWYPIFTEFSGILSWIDTNIENACEKTLMSCMYIYIYIYIYMCVTMINTIIFIIYLFGVYQTSSPWDYFIPFGELSLTKRLVTLALQNILIDLLIN